MIDRTYINTKDTDSMLRDIIELREKKEMIDKNRHSQEFMLQVLEMLWNERENNNE